MNRTLALTAGAVVIVVLAILLLQEKAEKLCLSHENEELRDKVVNTNEDNQKLKTQLSCLAYESQKLLKANTTNSMKTVAGFGRDLTIS